MKRIALTQGKFALVDDEDFDWLNQWKWYFAKPGYAKRDEGGRKNRKHVLMHRLIMSTPKEKGTDHIDGNGLNNQRNNLRNASILENNRNLLSRKDNKSGFKGVYWHSAIKRWAAQIKFNGKQLYLGSFNSKIEAAKTYNQAAIKYYGSFACLNKL